MNENQPENIFADYDGGVHRLPLTGAIDHAHNEMVRPVCMQHMRNKRSLTVFEQQLYKALELDPERCDMELLIESVLEDNDMSLDLLQESDIEDLVYNWSVNWERMGSPPLSYNEASDLITDDFLDIEAERQSD